MKNQFDSYLRILAKTSLIVFIGVFLSKVFTYLYRIIIARQFGPETYGVFSLAIMIAGWFIAFSSLGLAEGLTRYIPFYRGRREYDYVRFIFKKAVVLSTIFSIFAGILLYFLSEVIAINIFKSQELIIFLKLFSFIIPLTVLSYPLLNALRAYEKINIYSFIFNILQNFSKILFLIVLLIIGVKKEAVALSYLLGTLVLLLASYYFCKNKIPEIFFKSKLNKELKNKTTKELLAYSLPLLFSGIVSIIFYWVDSFSIGYFKSPLEVGLYNSAVPIALLLSIVQELFAQLFLPIINKEYSKKNLVLIKDLSKQITKWIFIINLPAFILLFLFPGAAINTLFGSNFLEAQTALRILCLGTFLSSIFFITGQLINMIGKSKIFLFNIVSACILNIILNYFLVPLQKIGPLDNMSGINGAAIATTISLIFMNFLFFIQTRHYLNIVCLKRKMISITIAAILALLVLLYLKSRINLNLINIILISSLFLLIYILGVFIFKGLDVHDRDILYKIKEKLSLLKDGKKY